MFFLMVMCQKAECVNLTKTEVGCPASVPLCGRGDSNPHALRHQILSLAWLPITTRPQSKIVFFFNILILPSVRVGVYLPEQFAYCHLDLLVAAVDHLLSLIADEEVGLQL